MLRTHPHAPLERDLASPDLWERSLNRSRHRRELTERSRAYRARRKAASYVTAATLVATPMVPRTVGAQDGDSDDNVAGALDRDERLPVLLRVGSTGARVADVQERLNVVAGAGLAVDGIYGPLTRGAVVDFQRSHDLADSGVVDLTTWRELFQAQVRVVDAGTPEAAAIQAAAGEPVTPVTSEPQVRRAVDSASAVGLSGPPRLQAVPDLPDPVVPESTAPVSSDPVDIPPSESPVTRRPAAEDPAPPAPRPRPRRPASTPAPTGDGCGSGRMRYPVRGTVTGRFGEDRGDHAHAGLDIATAAGTAIRAAACGTVSSVGYAGGYGNMVCIRHSGGISTCYAHMSRTAASSGRFVRVGQVIGYVGCTGSCTGPHVHFEVRVNGRATNPVPYLNGSRRSRATRALATRRAPARQRPVARTATAPAQPEAVSKEVASPKQVTAPAQAAPQPQAPAPEPTAPQSAPEPVASEPQVAQSRPAEPETAETPQAEAPQSEAPPVETPEPTQEPASEPSPAEEPSSEPAEQPAETETPDESTITESQGEVDEPKGDESTESESQEETPAAQPTG